MFCIEERYRGILVSFHNKRSWKYIVTKLLACRHCCKSLLFNLDISTLSFQYSVLEAYATGFHVCLSNCSNTAPNPKKEASADTLVSPGESYNASTVDLVSSCLISANLVWTPHPCTLARKQSSQCPTDFRQFWGKSSLTSSLTINLQRSGVAPYWRLQMFSRGQHLCSDTGYRKF